MYNVYNVLNSEYNTEHVNIAGSHKNGCYLLKLCKIWRYIIKEEDIVTKNGVNAVPAMLQVAQSVIIGQSGSRSPSSSSNSSPQPSATIAPTIVPRAGQFLVTTSANNSIVPSVGASVGTVQANGNSPASLSRVSAVQPQSQQTRSVGSWQQKRVSIKTLEGEFSVTMWDFRAS